MEMKMKTIQLPCLIYYLVALISINAIEREFDGNATIKASNEITTKENIKKKLQNEMENEFDSELNIKCKTLIEIDI